mmetsp:Transcript_24762/g.62667  ORF Transcript_24762/g.62667 Transcript_24762/m.62667 type:complete len:241 (+) Transcript_24762:192-914(+)
MGRGGGGCSSKVESCATGSTERKKPTPPYRTAAYASANLTEGGTRSHSLTPKPSRLYQTLCASLLGSPGQPARKPIQSSSGRLKNPVKKTANVAHGLRHQKLAPEDAEVALQPALFRPERRVRSGRGCVGVEGGRVVARLRERAGDRLREDDRRGDAAAEHVTRCCVHRAGRTAEREDPVLDGGERRAHGDVAVLLLHHRVHADAQVPQPQFEARAALVELHRGPAHQVGLLEEDLFPSV